MYNSFNQANNPNKKRKLNSNDKSEDEFRNLVHNNDLLHRLKCAEQLNDVLCKELELSK